MKPICVQCERFMRIKKTGKYFLEGMPTGPNPVLPGKAEPEKWRPYKLWVGDLWECPTCHYQTIAGVPVYPISEHYKPDFQLQVDRHAASNLLIKDC